MEAEMPSILCRLRDLMVAATRAEPQRRNDSQSRDWMPPMIWGADLASPYFLSMADRDAGWYQDRQRFV
jgi:hypothetical protein